MDVQRELVALLPRLRRFALTLTGERATADQLVQAVCQRAMSRIRAWKQDTSFDLWLYSLAHDLWIEGRRSRSRTTRPDRVSEPTGNVVQMNTLKGRDANATVTSLPDGLATVFLLVEVERFDYGQAAGLLRISTAALASRLAQARLQLAIKEQDRSSQRL